MQEIDGFKIISLFRNWVTSLFLIEVIVQLEAIRASGGVLRMDSDIWVGEQLVILHFSIQVMGGELKLLYFIDVFVVLGELLVLI